HLRTQIRGAFRCLQDPIEISIQGLLVLHVATGKVGIAEDRYQKVVEVMSDPPRKDTKTFQSLAVLHLSLQLSSPFFRVPRLAHISDNDGGSHHFLSFEDRA